MSTTVLLVDDHELIRSGLRRAFERSEDFEVVAEAGSISEGLRRLEEHRPDVAVIDVRLPDGNGLELVREARKRRPDLGIVVLTMYAGDEQLFGAMDSGASAFVAKDAATDEVVNAARTAAASPKSFSAKNLAEAFKRKEEPKGPQLSQREAQVLQLLADGLGVAAISRRLYISESTTKTHISKLYDKLGADNRASAIMAAVSSGLIRVPPRTTIV